MTWLYICIGIYASAKAAKGLAWAARRWRLSEERKLREEIEATQRRS